MAKSKDKRDVHNSNVKASDANPHGEVLLKWSVTPLRLNPKKTKMFIFSVGAFLGFIYLIYGEMLWVAFGLTAILISFHSFVLPSDYQFMSKGVLIRTGLFTFYRPWEGFKSVLRFSDGVLLDFAHRGLRRFLVPGQFIYFGADNKEAVLAIIEEKIKAEQ